MVVVLKEIGTEKRRTYDTIDAIEYRNYQQFRLWSSDGAYVDISFVRSLHKDAKCQHATLDVHPRGFRQGYPA